MIPHATRGLKQIHKDTAAATPGETPSFLELPYDRELDGRGRRNARCGAVHNGHRK